jgi:hypothetical protein
MKIRSALAAAAVFLSLLATACSSSSGPQQTMCYGANAVASAANNYRFSSSFTLTPVTVKSMSNLTFNWGTLSQDFLKHPLSATDDVNTVSVLMFLLDLATLQKKLNDDTLDMPDVYIVPPPSVNPTGGVTSAMLYDFTLNGTPQPPATWNSYFDPHLMGGPYSYMVAAAKGTTIGSGFRMLQTFQLDDGSSNMTVDIKNDSTKLSYTANLHDLTITGVPAGTPNLTLDFTDMVTPNCLDMSGGTCPTGTSAGTCAATNQPACLQNKKNALGGDFKNAYITSAIVGHYSETPAQLEAKFLDLDLIATNYYSAEIMSGSTLNFTTLTETKTGAAFPGIDDTGTWLVGLICGNCRNPAPWYLTIVKPCTP